MKQGKAVKEPETLATIQQRTNKSVTNLPGETRQLDNPISVKVQISQALQALRQSLLTDN